MIDRFWVCKYNVFYNIIIFFLYALCLFYRCIFFSLSHSFNIGASLLITTIVVNPKLVIPTWACQYPSESIISVSTGRVWQFHPSNRAMEQDSPVCVWNGSLQPHLYLCGQRSKGTGKLSFADDLLPFAGQGFKWLATLVKRYYVIREECLSTLEQTG